MSTFRDQSGDLVSVHAADFALVEDFLQGHGEVLATLRENCHTPLLQFLISSRATPAEAHEIADGIWAECALQSSQSRLEKYGGRCAILTWLKKIALNQLIDLRRRQTRWEKVQEMTKILGGETDHGGPPSDEPLFLLMRSALKKAIAACGAGELVMLQLVYIKGITQLEAGRIWGWSEPKVSRILHETMTGIATQTTVAMRATDPWLEVRWQDFVELCGAADFTIF